MKNEKGCVIMPEIRNNTNIVLDVTGKLRQYAANIKQSIRLNETESNIGKVLEQKNAFQEIKDITEAYKELLQKEIGNIKKLVQSLTRRTKK